MEDIERKDLRKTSESSDFHSDEVQDIIGRQPVWIVRWGITVLIMILLGIIIACCIIRYPQAVSATITLTTNNASSDLTARYTGILDSISVFNGDTVREGQILALIANAAKYEDVKWIEDVLVGVSSLDEDAINRIVLCSEKQLGDMQPYWLDLKTACSNFADYQRIDQIGQKKKLLVGQVKQTKKQYSLLEKQRTNLEKELLLEHQELIRDSILFSNNYISKEEYENTAKEYVSQKNLLDGFDVTLSNAQFTELQLEQQILELDLLHSTETANYQREISQAHGVLLGQLSIWKELYAIIAPCDGTVSLQNVWSKGQHVIVGDLIASVNPQRESEIIGRLKTPSSGFGKVKEGQEVNIRLNGFPYLEFGILKGVVHSISAVPEKTREGLYYTVEVILPDGLKSTYNVVFPFVQDMDGTADIITEDMLLIEQFTRPIRSLFVNR